MTVSLAPLSSPINISGDKINVLCIENKRYLRKVLFNFYNGLPEEDEIIFAEDYKPIKFKGNIDFIYNCCHLNFSSSVMKKLYESVSDFCLNEMQDEIVTLKQTLLKFFEEINQSFDYDFSYQEDVSLTDLFKIQNLKPNMESADILDNILDYILFVQKYSTVKCFVMFNLHMLFTCEELQNFYSEILKRQIKILIVEGMAPTENTEAEKLTILDSDMCEIVEIK